MERLKFGTEYYKSKPRLAKGKDVFVGMHDENAYLEKSAKRRRHKVADRKKKRAAYDRRSWSSSLATNYPTPSSSGIP
ncbi:hypothetical protein W97_08821 [Coniosporium apollinis CBS 100218]|uniref:Uncharacterized protein n=1 Tax=Coniosporium apollinis (strain CBS 100218) TaxID=1168221 RepID=R7Z6L0_CONA1|nr:uncharacterized protein W97_08821 [Coniosporium apollinis CBS 100218]EON69561.1 hypothetical protein W97_08821 [Coniosporium apollinis CBS 100218]